MHNSFTENHLESCYDFGRVYLNGNCDHDSVSEFRDSIRHAAKKPHYSATPEYSAPSL